MGFKNFLKEVDEFSKDVHIKKGKMHQLLGLKDDEKIEDKFSNGIELAKALLSKVKDRKEVSGMLAFAGNIHSGHDIFDDALKALKDLP